MYILTIYRLGVKIGTLHLGAGVHAIGRLESCAITLDDEAVSRMHANLRLDERRATVEDMGSANGVIVHNQKVQAAAVESGERIGIPPFELELIRITRDEEGVQHTVVDKATSESTRVLPPPRVELRLVKGSAPQDRYLLEFGQTFIGRGAECEIFLPEPHVSRRHAVLELGHDSLVVRDLGSTVGTFVGGRRVEQARLGLGDRVLVGNAVFEVHSAEGVALLPAQEAVPEPPSHPPPAARTPRPAAVVSAETAAIPVPAQRIAPTMPELPSLRADTPLLTPVAPDMGEMDTAARAPAPLFTPTALQRAAGPVAAPPPAASAHHDHDEHDAETQLHDPRESVMDRAGTRPAAVMPSAFDLADPTADAALPWNPPPLDLGPDSGVTTRPQLPSVPRPRRSALASLGIAAIVLLALAGVGIGTYLMWGEELLGGGGQSAVAVAPTTGAAAGTLTEVALEPQADPLAASGAALHVEPPGTAGVEDTAASLPAATADEPAAAAVADPAPTAVDTAAEPVAPDVPAVAAPAEPAEPVEPAEPAVPEPPPPVVAAAEDTAPESPPPPRPGGHRKPSSPHPAANAEAARALLEQGLAEAERGERIAAVRTLNKAAAAAPHGEIATQARERSDAIQAVLEQEIAPLLEKARQQEEAGQLAQAAESLQQAREANPFHAGLGKELRRLQSALDEQVEQLFDAGVIALQLGKTEQACASWRQAEPLCARTSPFFESLSARLREHCR